MHPLEAAAVATNCGQEAVEAQEREKPWASLAAPEVVEELVLLLRLSRLSPNAVAAVAARPLDMQAAASVRHCPVAWAARSSAGALGCLPVSHPVPPRPMAKARYPAQSLLPVRAASPAVAVAVAAVGRTAPVEAMALQAEAPIQSQKEALSDWTSMPAHPNVPGANG